METKLEERVVGQHEAVKAVSAAIRRSRAGLQDPHRPIGSFLFLSLPVSENRVDENSGRILFDDDTALIRLDMSEYMENILSPEWLGRLRVMSDMMKAAR